jgi:hypothetical protein
MGSSLKAIKMFIYLKSKHRFKNWSYPFTIVHGSTSATQFDHFLAFVGILRRNKQHRRPGPMDQRPGDRMSFWRKKITQNVAQPIFCLIWTGVFPWEKSSPPPKKNELHLYFFKCPKYVNNRPTRENSPNLVTLSADHSVHSFSISSYEMPQTGRPPHPLLTSPANH